MNMSKLRIEPKIEKQLRNAKYGVHNHSAVQICTWTKKSLHNEGFCYKQKFYGIDTHRCMEFSPSAVFCGYNCIFCWRPMEFMRFRGMEADEADDPREIYERLLEERRKLLSGFPGDGKTDMKKHEESLKPNHFAISLSGEPTIYPKLPELVEFLKNLPETRSVFIVTNGQEPEMMAKLSKSPPTQLYLSVNAPNQMLFEMINRPSSENGWERFLRSLGIFSKMETRRILRLTMIRGMNMDPPYIKQYADLIQKANPHFIEVKAYMWIGFSRNRLRERNMPSHEDIRNFSKEIEKITGFKILDEKEDSRVVLLANEKEKIGKFIK
ncbi:MAG: 4-demethylwyosine synthase TYW1 [Candidatus Aenigmarchaeota archaeon]|nr:4-demethylwyosine synthase TYW1 [Candidatus Aenigmarchaeota archaeon]NIQ17731.1 4-demethylwyosine synthase TYW1 [Candidatus Aenigmarchaeota archaeon]NIS73043.1 4-demethylwyosine synthase TYW1 [Candidatus Aenigmarchaeota archaeon]